MQLFLRLIAARPQLLTDHVQAYADLMAADFGDASAAFTRRVILGGAALMGALVTTLLAGVTLLLWAVVPATQIHAPWVLVVVPLVPLAACLVCLVALRASPPVAAFDNLRRQARADMAMLRESSAP